MLKKYIRIGLILSILLHAIMIYALYSTLLKPKLDIPQNEPYFEMVDVEEPKQNEKNQATDDVKKIINEVKQQPNILKKVKEFEKNLKNKPNQEPKIQKSIEQKPQNPTNKPKTEIKKEQTKQPQKIPTNNKNSMPTQNELANFIGKIRNEIDQLWHAENFNNAKALEATVEFSINQYGKLIYVKIIKSSNNNHFDKLLISIFKKLPIIKPPSQQILSFSLTFKSNKD